MKLLMCHCQHCKSGRSLSRAGKFYATVVRQRRSGKRVEVRRRLRSGRYDDLPTAAYIGYTD